VQLKLDAEIQTNIRRMGRRVSKKIGAGTGRRARADDDYVEKKAKRPAVPKISRVETKTHERFAEMFGGKPKPQPTTKPNLFGFDGGAEESDDDFALLGKPKTAAATKPLSVSKTSPKAEAVGGGDLDDDDDKYDLAPVSAPAKTGRVKRAAAAKTKSWIIEDDEDEDGSSDDDKMLGDVGAMVKGIGATATAPASSSTGSARLSLFAMSRSDSSNGAGSSSTTALPKLKTKASRNFADVDGHDDTNYEMLARSPQKASKTEDVDAFLSDDDEPPRPARITTAKPLASVSGAAAKKPRGRPAGSKNKIREMDDASSTKATAKPTYLSPAAKAYAAKKAKDPKAKKDAFSFSDDEGGDDDIVMREASPAPAKARGRSGRTAAAKAKPIYYIESDEQEDSMAVDGKDEDDFEMDDDDEY
jgi:DNA topoisomerase II